jgi:hypothetical protein
MKMLFEITETERDAIIVQRNWVARCAADAARGRAANEQWAQDAAAGLPVFPGGRTAAEWAPIGEASFRNAAHLPND